MKVGWLVCHLTLSLSLSVTICINSLWKENKNTSHNKLLNFPTMYSKTRMLIFLRFTSNLTFDNFIHKHCIYTNLPPSHSDTSLVPSDLLIYDLFFFHYYWYTRPPIHPHTCIHNLFSSLSIACMYTCPGMTTWEWQTSVHYLYTGLLCSAHVSST